MTNAMNTRQKTTAQLRKRAKKEQNTAREATVTCLGGRECCVGVTRESRNTLRTTVFGELIAEVQCSHVCHAC